MNDPVASDLTRALGRTLRQHAEDSPGDDGLLAAVESGVRRRRRRRTTAAAVAVVAAVAVPASVWLTSSAPRDTTPIAAPAAPTPWTTVSYRGVEVKVPAGWHVAIEPVCPRPTSSADHAAARASATCVPLKELRNLPGDSVILHRRNAYDLSAKESARASTALDGLQRKTAGGVLTKHMAIDGVLITVSSTDADRLERVLDLARRAPR